MSLAINLSVAGLNYPIEEVNHIDYLYSEYKNEVF